MPVISAKLLFVIVGVSGLAANRPNSDLAFNRSDSVTFSSIVSGTGTLRQIGPGTLTLTGANTYNGGRVIDLGTLLVDNARALGTGDVTVNGGVLGADPQPINVLGNYTQNAGG